LKQLNNFEITLEAFVSVLLQIVIIGVDDKRFKRNSRRVALTLPLEKSRRTGSLLQSMM
jgi:hypothetical protein